MFHPKSGWSWTRWKLWFYRVTLATLSALGAAYVAMTTHNLPCHDNYCVPIATRYICRILQNQVDLNLGGGRDNVVTNNVFYNPEYYAIRIEDGNTGSEHKTQLLDKLKVNMIINKIQVNMIINKLQVNMIINKI